MEKYFYLVLCLLDNFSGLNWESSIFFYFENVRITYGIFDFVDIKCIRHGLGCWTSSQISDPVISLPINARVAQVSIVAPILFLRYIDDLPDSFTGNTAVNADDTTLYF